MPERPKGCCAQIGPVPFFDSENLHRRTGPDNLAYIIYTSGSTGKPKGVAVPHRGLVNFLTAMQRELPVGGGDVFLNVTTVCFDISALELYLPLLVGGSVVLMDAAAVSDGQSVLQEVRQRRVTVLQATPSLWRLLLEADDFPPVTALTGGEALDEALADRLGQKSTGLWNLYGPTETTVWSTLQRIGRGIQRVTIGRPVSNTQVYVLGADLEPVPIGVAGELYIGGVGLARGYLHRPGLTAAAFVPDPFSDQPAQRLYKTGDLVRWRPEGTLEFLGRIDHQVKVRGFRIELGEIESVLARHASVREAVVSVHRDDEPHAARLVAYLVPHAGGEAPSVEALRGYLKQRLPESMVPQAYVWLESLPRTTSGKVDRRVLPAPEASRPELEKEYAPPRNATERELAAIWSEVLGLERVGVDDNFFELGGHSLLATQVVSRIRARFKVELPLRELFQEPTIARLAKAVAQGAPTAMGAIQRVDRRGELPLSFAQERLWFLDQLTPGHPFYNIPAAVQLDGPLEVEALERSLCQIARRHESLRTTFVERDGKPVQRIAAEQEVALTLADLSGLSPEQQDGQVRRQSEEEALRPFDLAAGPLWRARLLRLGRQRHVFLLVMHHIISDGWSLGVLVRELAALYEASCRGRGCPLEALPAQYADYAVWQRNYLSGERLRRQLDYWRKQLAGLRPLELPTDHPRPAIDAHPGAVVTRSLSPAVRAGMEAIARREDTTLFVTLLAAFKLLLHHYTQQSELVVGTGIAGRTRAEIEGLIGFFVNTLVLRTDVSGVNTFAELIARVRDVCHEAYAHQDVPFERLVEELQPERSLGRNPLCQVCFVLQNFATGPLASAEVRWRPLEPAGRTSKFDLTLFMTETPDGMAAQLEYNTSLFEQATAQRWLENYENLLESLAADGPGESPR